MNENEKLTDEDYTIIGKYLSKNLKPVELEIFSRRMQEEPNLKAAVHSIQEIWDLTPHANPEIKPDTLVAFEKVHHRIEKKSLHRGLPRWISYPWRIAASIALLLVITTFYWLIYPTNLNLHSSNRVNHLEDGTIVYLTEGSTLTYPRHFSQNNRKVTLTGQGYFDVEPDAHRPFTVDGIKSKITVLGTEFDLTMDSSETLVAVVEGKVALSSADDQINIILQAGESAGIDHEGNHLIEKATTSPLSGAWATGRLIFNQVPMKEVVQSLNKYFGTDIHLGNSGLGICEITTRFEKPELPEVIEELSLLLSLSIEYNNSQIILYGQGCQID